MSATRLVPSSGCSAGLVVGLHRPYFSHQLVLVYPAIAWIAALSMELIRDKTIRPAESLAIILLLGAGAVGEPMRNGYRNPGSPQVMPPGSPKRHPTRGSSPTTDHAYRAQRLGLPELAVWSAKRMIAGELPPKGLIAIVEIRLPEPSFLRRFHQSQEFLDFLTRSITTLRPCRSRKDRKPPVCDILRSTPVITE